MTIKRNLLKILKFYETNMRIIIRNVNVYLIFQKILSQIILDCHNFIIFVDNLEEVIAFVKLKTFKGNL